MWYNNMAFNYQKWLTCKLFLLYCESTKIVAFFPDLKLNPMYFLSFLLILQNKWLLRAQKWIEYNRFLNSRKIVLSIVCAVPTSPKMEFKLAG